MGLSLLLVLGFYFSASAGHLSAPLQEAKDSIFNLDSWKFQTDPTGQANEWAAPDFDDGTWPTLNAEQTWQEQGFANYHGTAWYRLRVQIPPNWVDSKILLRSEGVAEEYDVYVNGKFARHFGSKDLPVGAVPTQVRLDTLLEFGRPNVIALKVTDHGEGGGVHHRIQLRRLVGLEKFR
ncbi:MAG: sugar-binding domain-containing protein, partial [Bdellovibrionales bacterium]